MKDFSDIYHTACLFKGGEAAVEAQLPQPLSTEQLKAVTDDRFLSQMSLRIFRAGLKHSVVDGKWPAFEKAFNGFDLFSAAMLSDDDIDSLMGNGELIRHLGKIKAVRNNALMLREWVAEYGSVAAFLAAWPETDIIGLWRLLKQHGSQLGGHSGPRFLRMVGKDTFILTDDVVAALKAQGVVDKLPTAKKDLQRVQDAFNHWAEQSGRPLCQISRLLSFTADA